MSKTQRHVVKPDEGASVLVDLHPQPVDDRVAVVLAHACDAGRHAWAGVAARLHDAGHHVAAFASPSGSHDATHAPDGTGARRCGLELIAVRQHFFARHPTVVIDTSSTGTYALAAHALAPPALWAGIVLGSPFAATRRADRPTTPYTSVGRRDELAPPGCRLDGLRPSTDDDPATGLISRLADDLLVAGARRIVAPTLALLDSCADSVPLDPRPPIESIPHATTARLVPPDRDPGTSAEVDLLRTLLEFLELVPTTTRQVPDQ